MLLLLVVTTLSSALLRVQVFISTKMSAWQLGKHRITFAPVHCPLHGVIASKDRRHQKDELVLGSPEGVEERILPHARVGVLTIKRQCVRRDTFLG